MFKGFQNGQLILALDEKYASSLTQAIEQNITLELSALLGNISLDIMIEKLSVDTYATQEKKSQQQTLEKNQQKFLADEQVKKLEKIFQAKFSTKTIKPIKK